MLDFSIHENETERQYIWRVGQYVSEGKITWRELTNIINEKWRQSEDDYRDESAYRKPFNSAVSYYEEVFSKMVDDEYSQKILEQKRELEQAKIQFRDERVAWNKQNYEAARNAQKLEHIENVLKEIGNVNFNISMPIIQESDNDLLIMLSDLHIGQTFNSSFGSYNSDIAKERLNKYLNEIIKIQQTHKSENAYVSLLGDLISGSIHRSIQVTNRENIIEQIKLASELISSFCYELTKKFKNVYLTDCSGNHSRIVESKENSLHDEMYDNLIAWSINNCLKHIPNFKFVNNNLDIGISQLSIRDKLYLGVHGDYDGMNKSAISNLVMMVDKKPYAVCMGHKHYAAFTEETGIKAIQGGSLAGSGDSYTIEKRLSGKPSQTVCVCDTNGVRCIYPVSL